MEEGRRRKESCGRINVLVYWNGMFSSLSVPLSLSLSFCASLSLSLSPLLP
jgi:hypothetical protein